MPPGMVGADEDGVRGRSSLRTEIAVQGKDVRTLGWHAERAVSVENLDGSGEQGREVEAGRQDLRGSSGDQLGLRNPEPAGASSVTRCPSSTSPRASHTTTRWVPP